MPYCPNCGSEYADHVERCVDCDVALTEFPKRRRQTNVDFDFEGLLVVAGSAVVLIVAVGLIWLRQRALSGALDPAMTATITQLQPSCLVIFYYVAAIVSLIVLAVTLFRWLLRAR